MIGSKNLRGKQNIFFVLGCQTINNVLVPSWFLVNITRAVLSFCGPNKPCLWLSYWNWCCIEHKNSDAAYKLLFCGYRSPQLYRTMTKWSRRWWIYVVNIKSIVFPHINFNFSVAAIRMTIETRLPVDNAILDEWMRPFKKPLRSVRHLRGLIHWSSILVCELDWDL